jgi:hypothetical protein
MAKLIWVIIDVRTEPVAVVKVPVNQSWRVKYIQRTMNETRASLI